MDNNRRPDVSTSGGAYIGGDINASRDVAGRDIIYNLTYVGTERDSKLSNSSSVSTDVQIRAAAFLLGWYSMSILLPSSDKAAIVPNISQILRAFSIEPPEGFPAYLLDPSIDDGRRAQEYRQTILNALVRTAGKSIAQCFATAGNLMLEAAKCQYGPLPDNVRVQLQIEVTHLELTDSLSVVPDRDALVWLNRIAQYFESLAGGNADR